MKDLHYSIEVVYPKDKSQLVDSYTEAVFNVLKNRFSTCNIEHLILKLKEVNTKENN